MRKSVPESWAYSSVPEDFLGTIGQYPCVSKSNLLLVIIVRFLIVIVRYIPYIRLKLWVIFLEVLNLKRWFLKLSRFICN